MAGAITWRSSGARGNPDFPDGHPYICVNCGHVTVFTDDELFTLKAAARDAPTMDEPGIPCGACDSADTTPAVKCRNCGEYFPLEENGGTVCPKCRAAAP